MKAEGIEYDERMKELEKVEYPKPNRDFVYATFNEFADKHPWVGAENIRPKSVAREMVERFMTFGEYVREYELQRSEGLLLRYLTESYKTLVQTVPEPATATRPLDDVIAFLRTTVRGVDSSLLDEWERLRDPAYQAAPLEAPVRPVAPPPIWADARAFAARLRTELHRLLAALARKDWEAAADGAGRSGRVAAGAARGRAGPLLRRAPAHRRDPGRPQAAPDLHQGARAPPLGGGAADRRRGRRGRLDGPVRGRPVRRLRSRPAAADAAADRDLSARPAGPGRGANRV